MSKAIPLSNLQQERLGFVLLAKVPDDYPSTVGEWESDCVFIGHPQERHLFDDPGYLVIADRRLIEHRVTISNDGVNICFNAVASERDAIYLTIPRIGLGEWGIISGSSPTKLGCTQLPSTPRPRS